MNFKINTRYICVDESDIKLFLYLIRKYDTEQLTVKEYIAHMKKFHKNKKQFVFIVNGIKPNKIEFGFCNYEKNYCDNICTNNYNCGETVLIKHFLRDKKLERILKQI